MKRYQDIILFSSLAKLKESESKQKNIHFFYPGNLPISSVEKMYEALTMCVYLFSNTLENPPHVIRFGHRRSVFNMHCRILDGSYLFAYGRSHTNLQTNLDLVERATVLFNLLVFEFGCLACLTDKQRINNRITKFLEALDETTSSVFQTAIPRLSHMEPIIGQKAFNLLRVCQRQPSVVGGCIFYKYELLADHFPNSLTHVLAVLQRTNKTIGSRVILPHNQVSDKLLSVRLRQGVSLCSCFVSRDHFPKESSVKESPSTSSNDVSASSQLCSCFPDEQVLPDGPFLTFVPRLCCLASRAVLRSRCTTNLSSVSAAQSHGANLDPEQKCAQQHAGLECLVAYVEAHSDIFLCLLLREEEIGAAQELFDALYKLCFVLLRDLELCILRARDRDQERSTNTLKEGQMKPKAQYHAFTNSFRLNVEDKKTMNQHRFFLNRVHQAFKRDDDLEGVELSDFISSNRRGWREIAYVYEE